MANPISASRFAGRIGLITGAASGLGRDAALALAAEGARLVLFDRDAAGLAETAAACPASVAVAGDVSIAADMARAAAALDAMGRPSLLLTAAGILGPTRPLAEVEEAEWDRVFDVNVKGSWLALKEVLPRMAAGGGGSDVADSGNAGSGNAGSGNAGSGNAGSGNAGSGNAGSGNAGSGNGGSGNGGSVVMVASGAGLVGNPVFPAYSASKGAVVLMMRGVAVAHAAQGIRCNAVCPGQIETPMLRGVFEALGERAASVEAMFKARNPMGRFGAVPEVTAAVLFLLSDAAAYINGVALPIDGGRLA